MAKIPDTDTSLIEILAQVSAGRLAVDSAARLLGELGLSAVGDYARLDLGRERRRRVPEIVYGPGKTSEQLVDIVHAFLRGAGSVLCTKVSAEQAAAVMAVAGSLATYDARSGVLTARHPDSPPPEPCGIAGVLAAGTADVAVAEEAAAVMRQMGVEALTAYDLGVAGLHRLGGPLATMVRGGAAALVVAAGMEGALPSVVAGLVDVPVIGLPTSTGYGYGGGGTAALMGMLQSCSPGLVVVNIDNGVGAGATAALIAQAAARDPCS